MLNDYESSYKNLLKKSGNPSMNLRRTRSLCIGIYKTINNLNKGFMKNCSKFKKQIEHRGNNTSQWIIQAFGPKSLRLQGPRVWNALPFQIKSKENLQTFKRVIKFWGG